MLRAPLLRTCVVLAIATTLAFAQRADDPASWMPASFRLYVEASNASAAAGALGALLGEAGDGPPALETARATLARVAALGVTRAAFGAALDGDGRWMLFAEGADPTELAKRLKSFAGRATPVPVRVGAFAGLCDGPKTVDLLRAVANRDEKDLRTDDAFAAARAAHAGGAMFFRLDLKGTRWLRLGVARPKDAGQALLFAHVLSAAATATSVAARLDLDAGGLRIAAQADVAALPAERAFAAPASRPNPSTTPSLAPPPGTAVRLAVRRDLAAFWERRDAFVAEAARPGLAEFRNNLATLLGGVSAEELFASLGPAFDVYVGPPAEDAPAARHRFPTIALVAEVADPALRTEILLGFQTAIGIANAAAAQERKPRLLLETTDLRGVRLTTARYLPEVLPDPDDDRLQLRPTLAFAGSRLVLGSHPAWVAALLAEAEAGRTTSDPPGDLLALDGAAAADLVAAAAPYLAARREAEEGAMPEAARATVRGVERLLRGLKDVELLLSVAGSSATAELHVRGAATRPVVPR